MFPSKIKGIFAGLFASYKEQVTVAMGGDEVSATTSTGRENMPTARTNRVRRGRICATHTHQPETPPSCKHAGHGINDEKRSGSLL
eukprot:5077435-Pyramimonas_sp.AAC.1